MAPPAQTLGANGRTKMSKGMNLKVIAQTRSLLVTSYDINDFFKDFQPLGGPGDEGSAVCHDVKRELHGAVAVPRG